MSDSEYVIVTERDDDTSPLSVTERDGVGGGVLVCEGVSLPVISSELLTLCDALLSIVSDPVSVRLRDALLENVPEIISDNVIVLLRSSDLDGVF